MTKSPKAGATKRATAKKKPTPRDRAKEAAAAKSKPNPVDISNAAVLGFGSERDSLLDGQVPPTNLPDTEEAFYARDPFSADYADFLKYKRDIREEEAQPRVDEGLRADLLRRPHLMERPEESTHRGAAAVWRSLKDQLKNESLEILDRSDPEELQMLRRELSARQMVLASVGKGIEGLIKRVDQRLAELPSDDAKS